jgi:acetyltransferase
VILFGRGGIAVEVIADKSIALPPLNLNLARELVSRTRVWRRLRGYRDRPPANLDAILLTLLQVSQIVIDLPEVVELDVNPLLADDRGVLALDARIHVASADGVTTQRLAIRPYPRELEESIKLRDGREALVRPIRPEDEPAHKELVLRLTPEDVRFRFFGATRRMPHSELARFTQIDYDREMAFIATRDREDGTPETLGVVRAVADPDATRAEFAILVRPDLQGQGLGSVLMEKIIRYCRKKGIQEVYAQVLPDNTKMLALAERLQCSRKFLTEDKAIEVRLAL